MSRPSDNHELALFEGSESSAARADLRPTRAPLRVVGLFAGIGGIELGLHRAGHETLEFCEIDPFATAVLEARFPGIRVAADVREYRDLPSGTEMLTAGFPCQDLSQAGQTLGLDGERSSLVEEVFWILRHHEVEWLLLENVPFMLRLQRGRTLDVIMENLEELGYRWAYRVVDTRAFGLPQRRRRVFILASKSHDPRDVLLVDSVPEPKERFDPQGRACGFYWTEGTRGLGWAVDSTPTLKGGSTVGIPSPPAIWIPDRGIVTPGIEDAERLQGFEPGWTTPAETVGRASMRWKLVGNAVTVDVAEWIGARFRTPGSYVPHGDRPLRPGAKWPDAAYNVGDGRVTSFASSFPVRREGLSLLDFLDLDRVRPLSLRATAGFLGRFEKSTLKRPEGFLEALSEHLERVRTPATAV